MILSLNRSVLFGRDGQVLAKYDKIHLFDVDLPDGNYIKVIYYFIGRGISAVVDIDCAK